MTFRVLDLFSGIGGFSLGLERTGGFETVAFCEISPFCRKVLAKHWPEVRQYEDVRSLTADTLSRDGIAIDVICGGFPCQDISVAGAGAGIDGERSGLWSEYARLVSELRPQFVIVENVAALLGRGLGRVLGDLAALGFDAEWHCIPASAVGAPHRRDRLWLVAYPNGQRHDGDDGIPSQESGEFRDEPCCYVGASSPASRTVADATRHVFAKQAASGAKRKRTGASGEPIALGHANRSGLAEREAHQDRSPINEAATAKRASHSFSDADSEPTQRLAITWRKHCEWLIEPDVGRVAHGVPSRVDRLRALGNAVVPQIPELIGRAILASQVSA